MRDHKILYADSSSDTGQVFKSTSVRNQKYKHGKLEI
jgi:hypothetical protein